MIVFPNAYSLATIERRFELIATFKFAGIEAELMWDSERLIASVISTTVFDEDRRQVIASIEMEKTEYMHQEALAVERYWQQDANQIVGVVVQQNYREYGLATMMYELLVLEKGMVIVSDNDQYEGGKALWKHIAKKSEKLAVHVYDANIERFYPFDTDDVLEYTGNNISDEIIWSIEPDRSKYPVVLIADKAVKN